MSRYLVIFVSLFLLSCVNNTPNNATKNSDKHNADVVTQSENQLVDTMSAEAYVDRARHNLANEQISSAMKDINSALSLDKKNIDALLVLADIYYALGDEDNILLTLNKACEHAPLDPRPIVKLSELSFLQGNAQMANAYIDKALELDRYNPRAYFMRGMIALSANDTINAMKSFMTSRMQQDDFIDPVVQIAHIYAVRGDTLAKAFYKEALAIAPQDYSLQYEYAMYLQDNGFPEEAMECYDSLLEINPDVYDFIYNKGYIYFVYYGDNQKALECFDKALEIDPLSENALFNKGRVYEEIGDYTNAKSIYLQILRKNPNYQLAIDAINRLGE